MSSDFFPKAIFELFIELLWLCAPGFWGCRRRPSPRLRWGIISRDPVCGVVKVDFI